MDYVDFASKISFFEFIQSEFYEPAFKVDEYENEIDLINGDLTIQKITKLLESNPKVIDLFEEIFQLQRFTNAQYIHFCFDVSLLNNSDDETIISHSQKSIFKFENGQNNDFFLEIYDRNKKKSNTNYKEKETVFYLKKSIISYVNSCMKDRKIFYCHLKNSISSRLRIARYLVENLKADEFVEAIHIEKYLKIKRHPKDTKGIHGNFGIIKITKLLEDNNIEDVCSLINESQLSLDNPLLPEKYQNKLCFVREKSIEGILKKKDRKPKVFDFVIIYNRKPVVFIETNFYTTSGTKIGINKGEYVDLIQEIKQFNKTNLKNIKFMWVTDGNYWLTKDGESGFNNLKQNYFKEEHELLNYNLFREKISSILNEIKDGTR